MSKSGSTPASLGFVCALFVMAAVVSACGPRGAAPSAPSDKTPAGRGRVKVKEPAAVVPPGKRMSRSEAEKYFLQLINRDREKEGLRPVVLDATAQKAAQMHAEDMARRGYTAHWGVDGSVPEMRYTGVGGTDITFENAACFGDGTTRALEKNPTFAAAELEMIENAFMDEKPPKDGHRRNILTARHQRVGIGLAFPEGTHVPCVAQEFIDRYGTYEPLPALAKVGQIVHVAGQITAPATFAAVGVARIDTPVPRTPAELNETYSYTMPGPYVTYWPKGYVTPIPVRVDGNRFSIDVPLDDGKKPGVYEVSVWARMPESKDAEMVSLRTIIVK